MRKIITNISLLLLSIVAVSSCSSYKTSLPYFEDIRDSISGEFNQGDYGIKIIPDDELLITVTSMVPEATAMYNLSLSNPATRDGVLKSTQPQQQTYIVDVNGDIQFPVLGKLRVAGMSTQELTQELTSRISKDVDNPVVRVQLVNFRINVLGEVKHPGAISVNKERYSILDALADAGDLTEYGERSNVLLIREIDGKRIFQRMNLNSSTLLTSPYFYLQQNDVVYVEPNEIRRENAKYNQNNSYKISVVSTIVSACSVIASLVIALLVK
ncbi:MAG: polysaccharide biosynthesis/export family protein [Muribaculaceae bacterium]|nr:polysaccharide biosynthesis/export family protein [Muribaculaceae bacterium]